MPMFCKRISRRVGKRIKTEDGRGVTTVPDGSESAYIELFVDIDSLMAVLGEQAMRNRSNRAVLGAGMIVARATKRERVPEEKTAGEAGRRMLAALNAGMKDL